VHIGLEIHPIRTQFLTINDPLSGSPSRVRMEKYREMLFPFKPKISPTPFCRHKSCATSPKRRRNSPYSFFWRYFGHQTMWDLHSHFTCDSLCQSSINTSFLRLPQKQGPSRRRHILSDRQSLLGSHQRSWWFNEINYSVCCGLSLWAPCHRNLRTLHPDPHHSLCRPGVLGPIRTYPGYRIPVHSLNCSLFSTRCRRPHCQPRGRRALPRDRPGQPAQDRLMMIGDMLRYWNSVPWERWPSQHPHAS
jgi:hypothetical protein